MTNRIVERMRVIIGGVITSFTSLQLFKLDGGISNERISSDYSIVAIIFLCLGIFGIIWAIAKEPAERMWSEQNIKARVVSDVIVIDNNSLPIIKKASFWWDVGGNNMLQQKLRQANARDAFLAIYEDFKKTAPDIYQRNLENVIYPLQEKVDGIDAEYKKADELLQKAYTINIIPKQFRNIHAIWFIHDYITTSNESFSAALLHCDLDEIKQKLDEIIEQNNRIIIQNAIQIAQNSQMLQQNQQMLNRLATIESNTDRAAQYAEIASNNAEACAWIGLANYIRD